MSDCTCIYHWCATGCPFCYSVGIRRGMRFFQMYPRDFRLLRRIQCWLLGHASDYFLMDIAKFVSLKNWSRFRYTVGHCSRCGMGWEDWDRFPYGFGYHAPTVPSQREEKKGESEQQFRPGWDYPVGGRD